MANCQNFRRTNCCPAPPEGGVWGVVRGFSVWERAVCVLRKILLCRAKAPCKSCENHLQVGSYQLLRALISIVTNVHINCYEPSFHLIRTDFHPCFARLAGGSCATCRRVLHCHWGASARQEGVSEAAERLKKQCIIGSCYQIKAVTLLLLMALWRRQEAAQGLSIGANGRL